MGKLKDLTGMKFGRLTVINRAEDYVSTSGRHRVQWLCICDCGNKVIVKSDHLIYKHTQSCGCYDKEIHNTLSGLSKQHPKLYKTWHSMLQRCFNPKNHNFINYGGRGITVCNEWYDFKNFLEWSLNNGYSEELTIDRIDNNGNYEPNNCRWATNLQQQNNRRNNHYVYYKGEQFTVAELSHKGNIPYGTLLNRIQHGWSIEKAVETPIQIHKRNLTVSTDDGTI